MALGRRRFLRVLAGAATVVPALALLARAQSYPARLVRLIIGYPPGGSADLTARLLTQALSERLGQSFVVESRPGGGTNIATEAVVRASPDGYTLLLVAPANAINATLYEKLNYNFIRDTDPVAGLIRFPNVMVVNPSGSGQDRARVHCLCPSESGQDQHGVLRQRLDHSCVGGAVQDDDRR
jgi:tripartite-type tricarboxylate transporter receptor subunit TctC